jgi:hypothetical protein
MSSLSKLRVTPFALFVVLALSGGTHSFAAAQAPAAPPPPVAQPAPAAPPQAYPQQYPQQYAQPYQAYPQQYPQYQTYPQQYPQTVYVAPQVRQPRKPGPRRSLMIAGASVLLASYGVAVVTGAALVDGECRTCEDVGWSLLIPIAGPYIAAGVADKGKGLLVLLGTVQVIGVGLTIGGGIQYAMTKRATQSQALSLKLPRGRDVSFDVATSPRMMGPTMKLRF